MKEQFLDSLSLSTTLEQTGTLEQWMNEWFPKLQNATTHITGIGTLWVAAEICVQAAQDLKGVFEGKNRAQIAQTLLVVFVKQLSPEHVETWLLPLVEGEGCAALIEAAFRRLFPA